MERLPFGQPKLDVSGMEKRVAGNDKGIVESLVYFDKAGKEFTLLSNTITKEQLEKSKAQLEANLAVLTDPVKSQVSADAITANLAELNERIGLVK